MNGKPGEPGRAQVVAFRHDEEDDRHRDDLAGNVGAGLEYRVGEEGRWGLLVEARDWISEFDQFGIEDAQHDIAWTAGVSLNS